MLGLFGTLQLGARSLITQQQGVEVAGHNLANVNNPAYARQRLSITTSPTVPGDLGAQGTGVESAAIVRLRSDILDQEIQSEVSIRGSLESQQSALQFAQSSLGQELDSSAAASGASGYVGVSHSLADGYADLFASFQGLSSDPTSLSERQIVLGKAGALANQFNQIDHRLDLVNTSLNQAVKDDTNTANSLLAELANLNDQITRSEIGAPGSANDLRDLRQSKIEELSKLVKIDISSGNNGAVNVSIGGTLMVSGLEVADKLEAYDTGSGQIGLRSAATGTALSITGGKLHGTMEARDGAIADLRTQINTMATQLIQEVNTLHTAGYSLTGTTGAAFFSGTDASDIKVNQALIDNPALIQAASVSGAVGDNKVALALAQLAQKSQSALSNRTFGESYASNATAFGLAVSTVDNQLEDQQIVEQLLLQRRDSASGVSLDEEMTDLTRYQRAFQASARLITTVDELLTTVVNLKQ